MPAPTDYSRRRAGGPPAITKGELRASPLKAQQDLKRGSPDYNYGLGVAKVVNVDYEGYLITLRTMVGASQMFERVPVPLTLPGAGARHFLGAMPCIGDLCVIGWMVQESNEAGVGTKSPVILAWLLPGIWPGRDWVTTAEIEADEYNQTPADQVVMSGAFDRIRHKLRHIQPGNIVASSAQGSDLVLDEGVILANRRGNELRLRDQDQAFIARSLQQFHAMAGARIYAGMVQRDATFLPTTMVSDGLEWDGTIQAVSGEPFPDTGLPGDTTAAPDFLTPARMLCRGSISAAEGYLAGTTLKVDPYLDPYVFLRRGGFITETGYVVDGRHQADAVYGGKNLFRVASQRASNAVPDANARTLTEYRIEVTHTADGRLPVTEQTDQFDADRLPSKTPNQATSGGLPDNVPFIEWVLGSVVGNDPFSLSGRRNYGLPLRATVFDGDQPNPRLEPVQVVIPGTGLSPTPLGEQAATLFRLIPLSGDMTSTFWSVNKQGQMRAVLSGKPSENSLEAYLTGGLKLALGGRFQLLMAGHMELGTTSQSSLSLTAQEGCVRIFGGGPTKSQDAVIEAALGTGRGAGDLPSVIIEARTNARIQAEEQILIHGNEVFLDGPSVHVVGQEEVVINGTKKLALSTENFQVLINGKCQESYSGPKYMMPTNAPLHERTYAPIIPGIVCEKATYVMGDREETFYLGNHTTTILIGNMTYETKLGTWLARGATSELSLGFTGISGTAKVGTISLMATTGMATMSGLAGVTISAAGGLATVRGSAGVLLGGPIYGMEMGPILCAGTREPFTNLPYLIWGLGAKGHNIGL